MFAPSIWQADRIVVGQSPVQHILAGWVVAVVIGIAALAASTF